jgi:VIT1/CCC1 family predicted Fe2+/Mn2+ transporter
MAAEPEWADYYRDEMDAAWLYRRLAAVEKNAERRSIFERLALVEDAHVARWRELFASHGTPVPDHRVSFQTRFLATTARWFGPASVLPIVVRQETQEAGSYLRLARQSRDNRAAHDAALEIAVESAEHAQNLSNELGHEGEPWHGGGGSSYLRSVIYGFNDGLTANFGLVAGVIGADVSPNLIIVTGGAGALADALSMGASGYLAANSEAEVSTRQIAIEKAELKLMPDIEEQELALILEAKGVPADRARDAARSIMKDPEQALAVKVHEELGIQPPAVTPLADGLVTGTATAIGALIPLAPFFLMTAESAIWVSLAISMLAHFGIGAARSVFTGRGVFVSGRDMFLVGFGVAAAGYLIGDLLMGE